MIGRTGRGRKEREKKRREGKEKRERDGKRKIERWRGQKPVRGSRLLSRSEWKVNRCCRDPSPARMSLM